MGTSNRYGIRQALKARRFCYVDMFSRGPYSLACIALDNMRTLAYTYIIIQYAKRHRFHDGARTNCMTPSNHITPYANEKAKEPRGLTLGQALSQGEGQNTHLGLLPSSCVETLEKDDQRVAFCPKCCIIYGDPIQIEAIEDWGECLGCDKLNLLDLNFDPQE